MRIGRKISAVLGTVMSLAVLAGAGPASAEVITGTPGDDVLPGTPRRDTIRTLAGNDQVAGGRGSDRVFGGADFDSFAWRNGDGHDRIDGGADHDSLAIEAGQHLRLHLDALGAGQGRAAEGDLQVIGVRGVEEIRIVGTDRGDRLVLSSDPGILPPAPFSPMTIGMGLGDDRVDAGGLRTSATISGGSGDDEIRLGKGRNELYYQFETGQDPPLDAERGLDTIFGFGDDDTIGLGEAHPFGPGQATFLDTNRDGRLTAKDGTVSVEDGSMTIDLSAGTFVAAGGKIVVKLVGRTSLDIDQIINFTD